MVHLLYKEDILYELQSIQIAIPIQYFLSNCIKAVDKNNAMPPYKNQFTNTVLAIFIILIKLIQYCGIFLMRFAIG
jgi:hypothetical protein